jgi:hypothetical protein
LQLALDVFHHCIELWRSADTRKLGTRWDSHIRFKRNVVLIKRQLGFLVRRVSEIRTKSIVAAI